jgi:hypothetical protein
MAMEMALSFDGTGFVSTVRIPRIFQGFNATARRIPKWM